jgi:peptidoglycan-N-acetylglucosamine deacetylase
MANSRFGGPFAGTVCLTFDFDAFSSWLGPFKRTTPGVLSRGEYGARVGVPRILEMLDHFQVFATFFIPGHTVDSFPEVVREIAARGHEIGHHGYLHEDPASFGDDKSGERRMYERGIEAIERVTGQKPVGYRSPGWDLSPNSISLLKELGFRYDSSLASDDYNLFFARENDVPHTDRGYEFGPTTDIVEIPVSWNWDDFPQFEFVMSPGFMSNALANPSKVFEIWSQDVDFMVERVPDGVFDLTCHPQAIGRGHRIMLMERLIEHCRQYPSLKFARMSEAAGEFRTRAHDAGAGAASGV